MRLRRTFVKVTIPVTADFAETQIKLPLHQARLGFTLGFRMLGIQLVAGAEPGDLEVRSIGTQQPITKDGYHPFAEFVDDFEFDDSPKEGTTLAIMLTDLARKDAGVYGSPKYPLEQGVSLVIEAKNPTTATEFTLLIEWDNVSSIEYALAEIASNLPSRGADGVHAAIGSLQEYTPQNPGPAA